jgi:hypothetical protein
LLLSSIGPQKKTLESENQPRQSEEAATLVSGATGSEGKVESSLLFEAHYTPLQRPALSIPRLVMLMAVYLAASQEPQQTLFRVLE